MPLQVTRRLSGGVIDDGTGLADMAPTDKAPMRNLSVAVAQTAAESPVPDNGQHASHSSDLLNSMMETLSPIVRLAALTPLPTSVERQTAALDLPLDDPHASGTPPSAAHSHLACLTTRSEEYNTLL